MWFIVIWNIEKIRHAVDGFSEFNDALHADCGNTYVCIGFHMRNSKLP